MAGTAFSQPFVWRGSGGWGAGSEYNKVFRAGKIQTLTGRIVSIDFVTPLKEMSRGMVITIETQDDKVPVHLGPAWFIESQDVDFRINETVTVTGSRASQMGKEFMIASRVEKEDGILRLRNKQGRPAWSAWGRKGEPEE